jgi:RimJ/RimL family protein N-acetyltransferase
MVGSILVVDVIIREAEPSDAEGIIAYLQELAAEPDIGILFWPGEFDPSVEDERNFIQGHRDADNSILLVAEAGSQIVGVANCTGGSRKAMRHVGHIGITLHKDWRGQGIGTRMMRRLLEFATSSDVLSRIELEVYACNSRAIHIYEKLGFKQEGIRHRAYYRDGQYHDSIMMAILS